MDSKLHSIKAYIEKNYSETAYFYFAVTDIHFNSNQRNPLLRVEVSHYNSTIKTSLLFKDLFFHLVSEETYTPYFDNEDLMASLL